MIKIPTREIKMLGIVHDNRNNWNVRSNYSCPLQFKQSDMIKSLSRVYFVAGLASSLPYSKKGELLKEGHNYPLAVKRPKKLTCLS